MLAISGFCYILQYYIEPYETIELNEMEKNSLISSTLTIYLGIYFLSGTLSSPIQVLFLIGILLANAYFGQYFLKEFILSKAEEIYQIKILRRIFPKILKKLREVAKKIKWDRKIRVISDIAVDNLAVYASKGKLGKIIAKAMSRESNKRLLKETLLMRMESIGTFGIKNLFGGLFRRKMKVHDQNSGLIPVPNQQNEENGLEPDSSDQLIEKKKSIGSKSILHGVLGELLGADSREEEEKRNENE